MHLRSYNFLASILPSAIVIFINAFDVQLNWYMRNRYYALWIYGILHWKF